jgi:hypothetical protein
MMKYILALIACFLFTPLMVTCQAGKKFAKSNNFGKINNDNIVYDFNGQVKSVYTRIYDHGDSPGDSAKWELLAYDTDRYNKDGFKTDEIKYIPDQKEILRYIYKYNKADNIIDEISFSPPFPGSAHADTIAQNHTIYSYKYNSRGYVIKQNAILNGNYLSQYRYKVDSAGNNLVEKEYRNVDTLTESWKYKYNKDGNVFEEEQYLDSTQLIDKYIFTYDTAGRKLQIIDYNADGTVNVNCTRAYDDKGNFLGVKTDGVFYNASYIDISACDKKGNWLIETEFIKNKSYVKYERTIEYY